jgi:hypothetical protein
MNINTNAISGGEKMPFGIIPFVDYPNLLRAIYIEYRLELRNLVGFDDFYQGGQAMVGVCRPSLFSPVVCGAKGWYHLPSKR